MEHSSFIGVGPNPEGPDLPLGLGMLLAQNPKAMNVFGGMTNDQKSAMIAYIQGGATGEEAQARMMDALERLKGNQLQF